MAESAWTSPTSPLTEYVNAYGDTHIAGAVPTEPDAFVAVMQPIVARATRGVWLRLPFDEAHAPLLPHARSLGFDIVHHAVDGGITLQAWRGGPHNPTPAYAVTDVGASALVVAADGRILAVRERFDTSGRWHTPGGHVDAGEDVCAAAEREAREETGISGAVPLGVIAMRTLLLPAAPPPDTLLLVEREKQLHNLRFGSTNVFVCVLLAAPRTDLSPDASEIAEAAWLSAADFIAGAHAHESALAQCALDHGHVAAAAAYAGELAAGAGAVDRALQLQLPHLFSPLVVDTPHAQWPGVDVRTQWLMAYPAADFARAIVAATAAIGTPCRTSVEVTAAPVHVATPTSTVAARSPCDVGVVAPGTDYPAGVAGWSLSAFGTAVVAVAFLVGALVGRATVLQRP